MSKTITAVFYDAAGRITQVARAPAGILGGQMLELEDWRTDYDVTHYVAKRQLVERPANPAQLAGRHLVRLPVPCVIGVNAARYECRDGHAELEFAYPGTYAVTVQAFPYLDAHFSLTVP